MYDYYFIEIPLEDTRWENLTFDEYYIMSDEEKQEFKEYLESINAPYGDDFPDEDDAGGAYFYITWRDIVSMPDERLELYKLYLESLELRGSAPPLWCELECGDNCTHEIDDDLLPF